MAIQLLAAIALIGLLHTSAEARSCGLLPPIDEEFATSSLVVTGRVVAISTRVKEWPEPDATGERPRFLMRVATFEVEQHWKGPTEPVVLIETCEECSTGHRFAVGERWVVFASGAPPATGSCRRTTREFDPRWDAVVQWLEQRLPEVPVDVRTQPAHPLEPGLLAAFRQVNPGIRQAFVLELRTPLPGGLHVVVGRGLRFARQFRGDFADELFGIFVVDASWRRIEQTLEIFATPRWLDYEVHIEDITAFEVVVTGRGMTYGDEPMRRTYVLPK